VEKTCVAKAKKGKEVKEKCFFIATYYLICISPKHGMHGSLRCLKIYIFTTVETYFFIP